MKKNVLSIMALLSLALQVSAQNWVSTTAQNKNVILEEFTGIHCGYCPDGHRIANDMVTANPSRIFLVNIHSGGYAVPQTGEIDLRTTQGTAIDGSAGITGYPSGSVNRASSPWGQSRNAWSGAASTIMAQTSPCNVYVKSTVDLTTRVLTTEVEVYYTSAAAQTMNYLTVALTEDNILGTQSDYGNYNPTNWVNGKYKHNHVLRQHLSAGNFGDVISTTTKNYYFYKKYTTTIPSSYIGVAANLMKMHVVAYVSETSTGAKIISGHQTSVDFDPAVKTDLAINDQTVKPSNWCFSTINPKIEVTNNMDNVVTSFDVSAFLNGVEYKKSFSGSLAKGAKTTIDWGSLAFAPTGTYTVSIEGFKNVNANTLFDVENANDAVSFSGTGFKAKAFTTFIAGFETGTLPSNTALDISQNPKVVVTPNSAVKYGEFGSKYALCFYLHSSWNVSGKPGSLILGEANLASITDPAVGYYWAYSDDNFGGTPPTIEVSVSQDCGATWVSMNKVTCTQTGVPTTTGNLYDPKAGQYVHKIVPLTGYAGKSVLVKITGTPGTTGNAMYIDEVSINSQVKLAAQTYVKNDVNVALYPNPVSNAATVDYELVSNGNVSFTVTNMLNQVVLNKKVSNQTVGNHSESFDFSALTAGVYTFEVKSGNLVSTKKFVKN